MKKGLRHSQAQGRDSVETHREMGQFQAKERSLGQILSSWPLERANPADGLILDCKTPNCEKVDFCCLSHPEYIVTTVLRN
jgi:hypothetical protein